MSDSFVMTYDLTLLTLLTLLSCPGSGCHSLEVRPDLSDMNLRLRL